MLDTDTFAALHEMPACFAFGRFELRRRERRLLAGGEPVELGSRAFDVLLALIEMDGALVTKDALLDRAWPGIAVEENNLQVQISALRRALGTDRDWIATVPGRGYRFTGPVVALSDTRAGSAPRLPELAEPPRLSVMVLPFVGLGDDPARSWFTDAVTDSLTTDLTRALPGSSVVAHTTASTYKGQLADVRAIGRVQGVRYVVEGSVLLAEEQVRINAQLVEAETGIHLWAERFDMARRDVLASQDAIVGRLVRAVSLHMTDAAARRAEQVERDHPGQGTAEDFVLRGRAAVNQPMMTRPTAAAACALYERALERDPGNVDALVGIACVRVGQVIHGYLEAGRTVRDEVARTACLAEAEDKLTHALAIAPGHLSALTGRAMLLRARGLFADAVAVAGTALAHNPCDPIAHREIGLSLLYLGRAEEAVTWFQRTDTLALGDPMRWTWLQGLGRALIQLGRDAEAADALRLAVAGNPKYAPSHVLLVAALALSGEEAQARVAMAELRRAEPDTPIDVLSRRSAVPFEATATLYQARNARILAGLHRAAASADGR